MGPEEAVVNPHLQVPLQEAARWSFWVGGLGHSSIIGAACLFLAAILLWAFDKRRPGLGTWGARLFTVGCVAFWVAFGALLTLFLTQQFHFNYVFSHNAADHELPYRIAGVWSAQEGSILLWACMSAIFCAWAARGTGPYRRLYTIVSSAVLLGLACILIFESPFVVRPPVMGGIFNPGDGLGMPAPLLNYWVVIHPPIIFIGFGMCAVLFAYAFAALLKKDLNDWLPRVRSWAIAATTFVGVGLALGGFWAYEMLGWGGFWMWDPVENASLVVWVACAAFLHGIFVQIAKSKWHYTNALLGALPFLTFCFGTFMTRSGFLGDTSVHSFAEMDSNALWILITILVGGTGGFLAVWGWRQFKTPPRMLASPLVAKTQGLAKDGYYAAAIWLLLAFGIVSGFGMSVPLIMSLTGQAPRVVEEPLYHQVVAWLFPPLMIGMAMGPFISWRGMGLKALFVRFNLILAVTVGMTGVFLLYLQSSTARVLPDHTATLPAPGGFQIPLVPWIVFLTALCLFTIIANIWRMAQLFPRAKGSLGGLLTHVGVAMALLGLIVSRGLERKDIISVMKLDTERVMEYGMVHLGVESPPGEEPFLNRHTKVLFEILQPNGTSFIARPGLYYEMNNRTGQLSPVVWPYVHHGFLYDLYITAHPMVWELTEPTSFGVGQSRVFENYRLTFHGLESEGDPGAAGTRFFANLTVEGSSGQPIDIRPGIELGSGGGIRHIDVRINDMIEARLDRISVETDEVYVMLLSVDEIFPIEFYYKPLTGFVWLGVGLMAVGGFMGTWYRRRGKASQRDLTEPTPPTPEPIPDPSEDRAAEDDHASAPTAKS